MKGPVKALQQEELQGDSAVKDRKARVAEEQ